MQVDPPNAKRHAAMMDNFARESRHEFELEARRAVALLVEAAGMCRGEYPAAAARYEAHAGKLALTLAMAQENRRAADEAAQALADLVAEDGA